MRPVFFVESAIFRYRLGLLVLFALLTLFFGYELSKIRIDAGFEKLLPLDHEYIQTFLEHQQEFGGANRLLIAVRAEEGDIFTPEFFNTLDEVTDAVFFLPGVNRGTVQSIFTPNVRFIEIVEGGFSGGNVIPAEFQPTPEALAEVRENILKSGTLGRLVANDFSAAMVSAQLAETDPATGERLDYLKVAELLETEIRDKYRGNGVDIHIIGFARISGDIADGAKGVLGFFGIAFFVTLILVYVFTHSIRLTILPLFCALIALVWNLGLLTLLGYGLDPMSLLVPFLVFAIGVSHGVQMVNSAATEFLHGASMLGGARRAVHSLLIPGGAALLSDTIGFLTLLLINIRIIQELAITASLGVMVTIATNFVLLPILLSYSRVHEHYRDRVVSRSRWKDAMWDWLRHFTSRRRALGTLAFALLLGAWGVYEGRNQEIGDVHKGVPELRPDSRYNQDSAVITDKFSIGLDILTTIVETNPDGCVDYQTMTTVDRFAWELSNLPGVQSTISLPQVAKIVNAGWNEGHLKWRVLPRNAASLSQAVTPIETSTGLLNSDCSVMTVMAFLEDHKAETIQRVVAKVEEFSAEHGSEELRFRLATGNVGVMAATNQVVKAAQLPMLLYIYAAVSLLCLLTFRSWRATICIVFPLTIVSTLAYALMSLLDIGLKTTTLPVAALGVGIGVDYGIYIYGRMWSDLHSGFTLRDAYRRALEVAGNAVLVTALTLAIGVSTWIFSDLQFQADMGILLTFMFLANMLGAMVLLPALASLLLKNATRARTPGSAHSAVVPPPGR